MKKNCHLKCLEEMIYFALSSMKTHKNQNIVRNTIYDKKQKKEINAYSTQLSLIFIETRNFSRLRRLSFLFIWTKGQSSNKNDVISKTFLFMGNMSPYYFKTIFRLCVECIPSFIKIGGAVSEKNGNTRQTFVVLYIGCLRVFFFGLSCCFLAKRT